MLSWLKSKQNKSVLNIGYQTDIHSHLLPAIDDGSDNVNESLELINRLMAMGISRIVTTPHIAEAFPNTIKEISAANDILQKGLRANDIEIDFRYSAEYRLDDNFQEHYTNGQLIPFPGNYLLIENSYYQAYWGLNELIFKLINEGFHPILAHPERYRYYHNNTEFYDKIHNLGCKFQVNILSLAGIYGKDVKQAAYHLLNSGYIDFLATDAHHIRHINAIEDFIATSDYKKILSKVNLLNDTIPSFK
ncbi:MAG: hypothetical protein PHV20_09160 [Bacteroidales bacterium]|nr:hypothetical protein [Bacteroidales bacterium]